MRRVIIVGGGYAGIHAYRKLASARRGDVEIRLVSRDEYHTYHGWTAEVLNGRLAVSDTLSDLRSIAGDDFLQGEVSSVSLPNRTVHVEGAGTVEYDHLLIAIGSKDPLDAIEGVREHAWRLKDTHDMQALRTRLDAGPAPKAILVIGGGAAGVEMSSALALRYGAGVVTLISGSDLPLSRLGRQYPRIAAHARTLLDRQGVAVVSGARVMRVDAKGVELSTGDRLPGDMVLLTAGIALPAVPGTDVLPRNDIGQIIVDDHLRVIGRSDIWAAGDAAAVSRPGRRGEPCPVDALWAMKQGDAVGDNIARILRDVDTRPFAFKGMGQAAGMVERNGISELYGAQFTGVLAWLLRIGFFAWYMPDRRRGIAIMTDLLVRGHRRKESPPDTGTAVEAS